MRLIRNSWYVAAECSEVGEQPVARTILGEPVVLFRTATGMPVALQDRCPHRFMPLSKGQVVGEGIRCIYHGARFNATGACVGIPGMTRTPERLRALSYPVAEKFGWTWIWMGDRTSADSSKIPSNAWYGDNSGTVWRSGWSCFGSLPVGYQLISDNLMDITHAQYVHPESFGFHVAELARTMEEADGPERGKVTFKIDRAGRRISFWLCVSGQLTDYFHEALGRKNQGRRPDGDLDFVMHVEWQAPSSFSFHLKFGPLGCLEAESMSLTYLHFLTPESESSTHYFYKACHDTGDDRLTDWVIQGANFIFSQDKAILEAQQRALGGNDVWDYAERPVILPGDNLAAQVRTIIKAMQDLST
jgi:vanillate O-demethylase monooxygenase subunit